MGKHYVPCMVGLDKSWVHRARRAGILDGFHGYPQQDHNGKSAEEKKAYIEGFTEGTGKRF